MSNPFFVAFLVEILLFRQFLGGLAFWFTKPLLYQLNYEAFEFFILYFKVSVNKTFIKISLFFPLFGFSTWLGPNSASSIW